MAGGFGTRLRPLTNNVPKPMIPVVNKPMMEHIVDLLRRHGITDLVTLLHFRPELIENHFGDGSAFGVTMTYVSASEDFGTAGAVKNAEAHLSGPCLVISGDVLTDFDLSAAIAFHRERRAAQARVGGECRRSKHRAVWSEGGPQAAAGGGGVGVARAARVTDGIAEGVGDGRCGGAHGVRTPMKPCWARCWISWTRKATAQ